MGSMGEIFPYWSEYSVSDFYIFTYLGWNDMEKKKENVIPTSSFQILMKNLNYFLFFCHIYV